MKNGIPGGLQHRHETCCEKGGCHGRRACRVQRWHHCGDVVFRTGGLVYDTTIEGISAERLARLFWDNIWKLYRLLESIVSDRGLQFAAEMIKELNGMLEIKTKLSIAFYPQIDHQTERMNQKME